MSVGRASDASQVSSAAVQNPPPSQRAPSSQGLAGEESSLSDSGSCFESLCSFLGRCATMFIDLLRSLWSSLQSSPEERQEASVDLNLDRVFDNQPAPAVMNLAQEISSIDFSACREFNEQLNHWFNSNFIQEKFGHVMLPYQLRTIVRVYSNNQHLVTDASIVTCSESFQSGVLKNAFAAIDRKLQEKGLLLKPHNAKIGIILCVVKEGRNSSCDIVYANQIFKCATSMLDRNKFDISGSGDVQERNGLSRTGLGNLIIKEIDVLDEKPNGFLLN